MRVIEQIIWYLAENRLLTVQQLELLRDEKFLPTDDLELLLDDMFGLSLCACYMDDDMDDPRRPADDDPWSRFETEDPRSRRRRRRRRAAKPGNTRLTAGALARRIRELSDDWQSPLLGLSALATRLGPCEDWHTAARLVRNSDPDTLRHALAAALDQGRPSTGDLWGALTWDGYREAVRPNESGPAVGAYRHVLASQSQVEVRKHAWILRHDPIAAVADLRVAQWEAIRALGRIYDEEEDKIALALRRDCDATAFWTFVLVYNARRPSHGLIARSELLYPTDARILAPPFPTPQAECLPKAWMAAVLIDGANVVPLLCRVREQTGERTETPPEPSFFCPLRWLPRGAVASEPKGTDP